MKGVVVVTVVLSFPAEPEAITGAGGGVERDVERERGRHQCGGELRRGQIGVLQPDVGGGGAVGDRGPTSEDGCATGHVNHHFIYRGGRRRTGGHDQGNARAGGDSTACRRGLADHETGRDGRYCYRSRPCQRSDPSRRSLPWRRTASARPHRVPVIVGGAPGRAMRRSKGFVSIVSSTWSSLTHRCRFGVTRYRTYRAEIGLLSLRAKFHAVALSSSCSMWLAGMSFRHREVAQRTAADERRPVSRRQDLHLVLHLALEGVPARVTEQVRAEHADGSASCQDPPAIDDAARGPALPPPIGDTAASPERRRCHRSGSSCSSAPADC